MSAQDALRAMRGRLADIQVRVADDIADLDRFPTRLLSQSQNDRRVLARHNAALVEVVEAVLDEHRRINVGGDSWVCAICPTVTPSGGLAPTPYLCPTVTAIENKLEGR